MGLRGGGRGHSPILNVLPPTFHPQQHSIVCHESLHLRLYSLPANPRHWSLGPFLPRFKTVWFSVGATPQRLWPLFCICFVSKLYFAHTKVTVVFVFLYFLDVVEVTVGSSVDGAEIPHLIQGDSCFLRHKENSC